MSVVSMSKYGGVGGFSPKLFPGDRMGDALADICQERWHLGRRKAVAREWNLSDEQARAVCEGAASKATLELIFQHDRGGWPLVLEVFARVIGEGLDQHLSRERAAHEKRAARLATVARDLRALGDPGRRDGAGAGVRLSGELGDRRR